MGDECTVDKFTNMPYHKLKLLTWNIWFDILDREQRMAALIEYIFHEMPDVVCLQEVVPSVKMFLMETSIGVVRSILDGSKEVEVFQHKSDNGPNFIRGLLSRSKKLFGSSAQKENGVEECNKSNINDPNTSSNNLPKATKLTDYYVFSDNEIRMYGLLTLVKKPEISKEKHSSLISETKFTYKPFITSNMNRGLLLAILNVQVKDKNVDLVVATSHLESLSNEKTRESQIKETAECLKDYPRAVFCGDFNFDSTKSYGDWVKRPLEELENIVLQNEMPDFIDSWIVLKQRNEQSETKSDNLFDPGYTFDGISNPKYIKDQNEQMRYDRVMAKGLVPKTIEVAGKEEICVPQDEANEIEMKIKISDHYGLLTEFEIS